MGREPKNVPTGKPPSVVNIELKKSQPSVELKRDSKGKVNITVKVYDDDVQDSSEDAQAVFDALCQKYGED